MTTGWLASRSRTLAASAVVTSAATAFVIVACGYYESVGLLVTQVALIGGPILVPLVVSALASRNRPKLWWSTAAILALGWGFVVYCDAAPSRSVDANFAIIAGWLASAVALALAVIGVIAERPRRG